ncbi:hypothetical protein BC826DRAFT_54378 [Russula brevipes]|nr:hypothetical protein BC826DRAFT_54378 [Russula brevipes]
MLLATVVFTLHTGYSTGSQPCSQQRSSKSFWGGLTKESREDPRNSENPRRRHCFAVLLLFAWARGKGEKVDNVHCEGPFSGRLTSVLHYYNSIIFMAIMMSNHPKFDTY